MTEDQKKPKRPSHLRLVRPGERATPRPTSSPQDVEAQLMELAEQMPGMESVVDHFRYHRQLFEQLAQAREAAGLSQAEVARRMVVPRSAVERLERGEGNPLFSTIERYVGALGKKIEWQIS